MTDPRLELLRRIAVASPAAMRLALHTLQGHPALLDQRLSRVARLALEDRDAELDPNDRRALVAWVRPLGADDDSESRTVQVNVRLSPDERDRLSLLAQDAGLTVSEYVRRKALTD